jgi:hypothetical protein
MNTANDRLNNLLLSLPPSHREEFIKVIMECIAEAWNEQTKQLIQQEFAKYQSGITHVARIDTSVTPKGYENRVVGYGEEFTLNQPVVTTVENLLQAAIRVSRDITQTQHFDAAYGAMQDSKFIEAFSLLAPVINYGVRPGSIDKSPATFIAQAAYMLLLIGRDINNPTSAPAKAKRWKH